MTVGAEQITQEQQRQAEAEAQRRRNEVDANLPRPGRTDGPIYGPSQYGTGQSAAERQPNYYGTMLLNPSAYQYGGHPDMAASEAARYRNIASAQQQIQQDQYGQYGQALGMSDQARGQQMQGLGYLQQMAMGQGPSAAQAQLNQSLAAARNQQAAIAASARGGGGNLAAAQAASAQAAGQMGMQGIQQASLLRAQEQIGAMNAYSQQAGQLRASDFGRAQLATQQQQLAAGQAGQYEGYGQAVLAQQQQYQQAAEQQALAREAAVRGWNLSQKQGDRDERNTWIQAGTQAAATAAMIGIAAASDARTKENVSDGGADVDEAIGKLKPVSFSYKKEFHGAPGVGDDGEYTGIMAQDLASSKAGSKAVIRGADGILRVHAAHASTLALAGLARLSEKMKKWEERDGRKR